MFACLTLFHLFWDLDKSPDNAVACKMQDCRSTAVETTKRSTLRPDSAYLASTLDWHLTHMHVLVCYQFLSEGGLDFWYLGIP